MSADKARGASHTFWMAHTRCAEWRPLPGGKRQYLLIPDIVLMAFSIETGFKALIWHGGTKPKQCHELVPLFRAVPIQYKRLLLQRLGMERPNFAQHLAQHNKDFDRWRYLYETLDEGKPFSFDIGFLTRLGDAVQSVLVEVFGPPPA